jgi:hypothetical protein
MNETHTTEPGRDNGAGGRAEPLVMPLRMTRAELQQRVYAALREQPRFAKNENFHLAGWDAAKVAPTAMALLVGLGFVELDEA